MLEDRDALATDMEAYAEVMLPATGQVIIELLASSLDDLVRARTTKLEIMMVKATQKVQGSELAKVIQSQMGKFSSDVAAYGRETDPVEVIWEKLWGYVSGLFK
jgi:hypothetical protein